MKTHFVTIRLGLIIIVCIGLMLYKKVKGSSNIHYQKWTQKSSISHSSVPLTSVATKLYAALS